MKRARSRTTFTDLIGLTEKHDDDLEKELLDDMRSNKFPRHRAHWLIMDPLQKWRLKWDILMMLLICFVMVVTPFELAFVSAVGWSKNYTPFPNKYTGLFITNWTVNLLFIVDIVFNFLTAVYDPQLNKWLLRFDQIAVHYARLDAVRCCVDATGRVHDQVQTSLGHPTVASLPADEAKV